MYVRVNHTLRAMRLTAFLITACCLSVSAGTLSQSNVTFSGRDVKLEIVFQAVRYQTGYYVICDEALLGKAKLVTIEAKNLPIADFMDLVLKGQELTWMLQKTTILIQKKKVQPKKSEPDLGKINPVKGTVSGPDGQPVANVNVVIKGTNKGTITNSDGTFSIDANPGDIIIFSSVEFGTKEIRLNGSQNIVVALEIFTSVLDEVQYIAYGQQSKRFSVSNISSVKAADIEKQPVQNPLLALQGRVPGLVVTQNSGVPGGGITVRIQGQNSIRNGNDPLYVIDGVPVSSQLPLSGMGSVLGESGTPGSKGNPLNYIDINCIESIEVLKDADATSIFGSRAANGAILITTKRGKVGRTSFDVKVQSGIGKLTRDLKMMNTRQYLDMRYEALKNDGLSMDPNRDYDLTLWDTTRYTDWQKELLGGTAKYHNVNATLQGGTSAVQYRISGNYIKETTVFPGDFADEKASVNFAITNKSLNGKFNLVFSGNYLYDKNRLPTHDITRDAIGLAPDAPSVFNPDGTINWAPASSGISTFISNPIISQYRSYENITDNLISNLTASYFLLNDLSFKTSIGYSLLRSNEFIGNPLLVVPPESRSFPQQRWAQYGDRKNIGWNIEPQIIFKKKIKNHHIDILTGLTFNSNSTNAESVIGHDYLSDELLRNKAAAATLRPDGPTTMSEYRYNALFGRLSYNYLNKYIINLNARRDGSSRFGKENRFENFGSIGGAWIFTEEGFIRRFSKSLSFGKLKISYGSTGSDQIPDYNYLSLYSLQNTSNLGLYQGVRGLEPNGLPNPHLQWEKTKKFNTGIDLGFFENRILLNVNYGINRSSNQLLNYVLASTTGFPSIYKNFPALIENTSWEFALNTTNIKGKDFQWTSNVNLTIPNNKLVEFPNLESSSYANSVSIGQPINTRIIYKSAGVNPTTGFYQFYTEKGYITSGPATEDMIYLNTNPRFYGGFENTIVYKNFQLDFHFQFTKQLGQNVLINNGMGAIPGYFSINEGNSNQPVTVLDRWQKPGDQSLTEKFSTSNTTSFYNTTISTAAFTDASFVRLKNISVSYLIPKAIGKSVGLNSGRVFFQAQNLLTITNYKGLDPESQRSMTLPPLTVMTFGVQLSF